MRRLGTLLPSVVALLLCLSRKGKQRVRNKGRERKKKKKKKKNGSLCFLLPLLSSASVLLLLQARKRVRRLAAVKKAREVRAAKAPEANPLSDSPRNENGGFVKRRRAISRDFSFHTAGGGGGALGAGDGVGRSGGVGIPLLPPPPPLLLLGRAIVELLEITARTG